MENLLPLSQNDPLTLFPEPSDSDNLPLELCLYGVSSTKLYLPAKILAPAPYELSVFLDSGADSDFIDKSLVEYLKLPLVPLTRPIKLRLGDKSESSDGVITHRCAPFQLCINGHTEWLQPFVTKVVHPLLLGFSWLQKHNPLIDWTVPSVTFSHPSCLKTCCSKPVTTIGIFPSPLPLPKPVLSRRPAPKSTKITGYYEGYPRQSLPAENAPISVITCQAMKIHLEDENLDRGIVFVDPVTLELLPLDSIYDQSMGFFPDTNENPAAKTDPLADVPDYVIKKYKNLFSKSAADSMPPRRPNDVPIKVIPGATPTYAKVYSLTAEEDATLVAWLKENLGKNFITPSSSPWGAPCFFVKKKDGSLRLCMDYRALNKVTVKDRNPLPLISDLLRTLGRGKIFTTLDLRGAYNLLRIKEGDESKTAFITKYGQFESNVLLFGLANAPAQFQAFMNHLFRHLIGVNVLVYLDDIVIFSDDTENHEKHVKEVFQILEQNHLYVKPEKCFFHKSSISYLGYIISSEGISMDPIKTKAVSEWPAPKTLKELQMFLGFCNFYRSLIPFYARLTLPLTELLKKNVVFAFSEDCQKAFDLLKQTFCSELILGHPDESKPYVLETDASDYAIGSLLYQFDDSGVLRPIAYYSRKMVPAERNYEIYDKELLAIVKSFAHWRHFLLGGHHAITVFCDHKNLEYFMTTKQLTRRQARWAELLSEYNFQVTYRSGLSNVRADAMSRRPDHASPSEPQNLLRIISPEQVVESLQISAITAEGSSIFHSDHLDTDFTTSDWPLFIADFLLSPSNSWLPSIPPSQLQRAKSRLSHFAFNSHGTFCHISNIDKKTLVPYCLLADRPSVLKRFHDELAHLAFKSIIDLVERRYWWPNMKSEIRNYISTCPQCQLSGNFSENYIRPAQPIPSVAHPFERWGIDFVGILPKTRSGNRYIFTAIDYATRWPIAVPCPSQDAATVAQCLYKHILMEFGSPFEIFSDQGKSFLSSGIQSFVEANRINHLKSTPYHPRTNGMVERMHAPLGKGITTLVNGKPERWDEYLPQVLWALRIRSHSVTGYSPFFLLYSTLPRLVSDPSPPVSTLAPPTEEEWSLLEAERMASIMESSGEYRAAANIRTRAAADQLAATMPTGFDLKNAFEIGDMVKLKHREKTKFEFKWKGPYHIVQLGYPGTYWLMDPQGRRLPTTVNQAELSPWLARTPDNVDYFYDGTARSQIPIESGIDLPTSATT